MSRTITVSNAKDDCLEVSAENCSILINELRIRQQSNWVFPFLLLGKGGSSLALTYEQLCYVMAEFLRLNKHQITESETSFECKTSSVGFNFLVQVDVKQ